MYRKEELLTYTSTNFDGEFEISVPANLDSRDLKISFKYIACKDTSLVNPIENFYKIILKEDEIIIGSVEVHTVGKVKLHPQKKKKYKKKHKTVIGTPRF